MFYYNISLPTLYIPEYLLATNGGIKGIIRLKNSKYIPIKEGNDIIIYNEYIFYTYNKYKRLE